MNPRYLSDVPAAIGPAMANHLWQSTLFAALAVLLTLAFRKNQARIRHHLWLAASLKFLVPLSLLIAIGRRLASPRFSLNGRSALFSAVEGFSQPFTFIVVAPLNHTTSAARLLALLPELAAAVWLCGFVTVVILWSVRWRRVAAAAQPLDSDGPGARGRCATAVGKGWRSTQADCVLVVTGLCSGAGDLRHYSAGLVMAGEDL